MANRFAWRLLGLAVAVLSAVGGGLASAQELAVEGADAGVLPADAADGKTWRFKVGLGLAVVPDYVGSNNYTLAPLPKLQAAKGFYQVDVTGNRLTSNVVPLANWQFGPSAQYISNNRCSSDDNRVNNMHCLHSALMVGGRLGYAFTVPSFIESARIVPQFEVLGDVSGANDGLTFEPRVVVVQPLNPEWTVTAVPSLLFGSESYENYYFGVTARQSRQSGLRQYDADGGLQQVGLLATADWQFAPRWGATVLARYARLVGDAEDSPLVDGDGGRGDANQFAIGGYVSYNW